MSLTNKKKEPKQSKTVVIQPIVKEQAPVPTPTVSKPAKNLNRFGEERITGKQVGTLIVSAIPFVGCLWNGVDTAVRKITDAEAKDLNGKEKAKVIAKAGAQYIAKGAVGIVASRCLFTSIVDNFDTGFELPKPEEKKKTEKK